LRRMISRMTTAASKARTVNRIRSVMTELHGKIQVWKNGQGRG